ncbi:3731_t:CDS:1, partial [Diversispora eburnea]
RQFRLLREEMLNAFRTSINSFLTLIGKPNQNRVKIDDYKKSGGRYRNEKSDSGGDLNVYPNVHFTEVIADSRNGFFFCVAFTPPSKEMSTRTEYDRRNYWKDAKKLGNGNLVCLLWPNEDINNYVGNSISISSKYSLYFGTIAYRNEYILARNKEFAEIGINFIDTSLHPIAIKDISLRHKNNREIGY